ncbi:MAG: Gfo/Idh/MocA family oxidoreductase [Chloroflexi bacterium]|nr:Gfo/Idh/MocA family oxidoreductase [Chloroflexota bacterium]
MRVVVIGCGGIGRRRADTIRSDRNAELIAVADVDPARANQLAAAHGCAAWGDPQAAATMAEADAIVISTPNVHHATLARAAFDAGKHVLVEKPLARNPIEAAEMVRIARMRGRILKTGFNHRYYPSVARARALVREGAIGEPVLCRCRYGHGARESFPSEWFANRELSGGGTFLDNGVHALDLFRVFLGDFDEATGFVGTLVHPVGACEDNGMGVFRSAAGRMAMLHSSWTQWDSGFSFEVFGREGFIHCESNERVTMGRRLPVIGHPPTQTWNFPGLDRSWDEDWTDFSAAVREGRDVDATGEDGLAAVQMAYAVYEASRTGRATAVPRAHPAHA